MRLCYGLCISDVFFGHLFTLFYDYFLKQNIYSPFCLCILKTYRLRSIYISSNTLHLHIILLSLMGSLYSPYWLSTISAFVHKIDFFPNNSFLFLSIHYMFIRLRSRQYQLSKDNIKWSKYDFLKMKDGKKQWTK